MYPEIMPISSEVGFLYVELSMDLPERLEFLENKYSDTDRHNVRVLENIFAACRTFLLLLFESFVQNRDSSYRICWHRQ